MPAEPRRVLMTADAVGGVWTFALDLAHALAASNVEVVIATMGPLPSVAQRIAAKALENVQLVSTDLALEWMDDPWADVDRAGEWLLDLETRLQPDIVHLNGYAHASLPFQAPVLVAGHSCLLSWAEAVPGAIDGSKLSAYFERVAPGIRTADFVVAPTAAVLAALRRHYGALERSAVVHNGRRRGVFRSERKEPFILTAGRLWDPAKNIAALAAIAPKLPWPTAAAGPAATDERDRRVALSGIRALGKLDEPALAGWLARASIFALPARYEPFGLLPLEAALSRCALVLGDIPSLHEVWGDTAEFVPPDDRDAIAHAIGSLISSPLRLTERAAAAYERATRYSTKAMAAGYLSAYRNAASSRRPQGAFSCAS